MDARLDRCATSLNSVKISTLLRLMGVGRSIGERITISDKENERPNTNYEAAAAPTIGDSPISLLQVPYEMTAPGSALLGPGWYSAALNCA
jgi:hypothetical protein